MHNVNFENYDEKSGLNTTPAMIMYQELIGELKRIEFSKSRKFDQILSIFP
jgi:hypothetical protein